ncbi:MAG TPA: DUF6191 domain-containing protein [Pseudonocardiaceae bacterium]|nr:DUF6191 domain-containing protein [Pseudonocardiaceae bacterium]
MMRDEDSEGAPPLGVDLDRGTVVLPATEYRDGSSANACRQPGPQK